MTRKENMKRKILLVAAAGLALLGGVAFGKELNGVTFPDEKEVAGSKLVLNGLGLRQATMMKINVYVAALYVASPSSDPTVILDSTTPKEISLRFVRNVGATDLSKAWDEGFTGNAKEQLPALKERIEKMKSLTADMKKGEELTFTSKPGVGVEVTINGVVKGVIEGDDFAKALFSIWLGANPPNPGIKPGLLGK
jgi:hypothetical protein